MSGMIARAKQTSQTTGTGALTLIAPPTGLRSFNTQFGAGPVPIFYAISGPSGENPTYFEYGKGTFTNASSSLTRDTVFANSNGTTTPINLPSGTHDVFAWVLPIFAPVTSFGGTTKTMTLSEVGSLMEFTGSADCTFTLPAVANVPDGVMIPFANIGTANLILDGNSTEQVEGGATFSVAPAGRGFVYLIGGGTAWRVFVCSVPATQAQMEAAAVNAPVTAANMNWHPGVAKAWINFNGTGTIATRVSHNVAGITDNGVGDYAVTWDIDFSSGDYCHNALANAFTASIKGGTTPLAGSTTFTFSSSAGAAIDPSIVCACVFGDQ